MTDLISSLADQIVVLINASPRSPTKTQIEEVLRKHYEPFLRTVPGFLRSEAGGVCDRCGGAFPLRRLDRVEHEKSYFTVCKSCQTVWKDEAYRAEAEKVSRALRDAMNTSVYGGPTVEDREKFWAKKLNEPFTTEGSPGTEGDAAAGGITSLLMKAVTEADDRERKEREGAENILAAIPPGQEVQTAIMPLPYKDVSASLRALMDAEALSGYPGFLQKMPAAIAEKQRRQDEHDKRMAQLLNEPFDKAAKPCPGSTDGSHEWHYLNDLRPGTLNADEAAFRSMDTRQGCRLCGAVKP